MSNNSAEIYRTFYFQTLFDINNSDSKASLKQQKSQETTTDTQDVSKFYWLYV